MQNADTLAVAEVISVATDASYTTTSLNDELSQPFLIGVLCKEQALANAIVRDLRGAIRFLPIARLSLNGEGRKIESRQNVLLKLI